MGQIDQIIDLLDASAKRYPIKALCDEIGKGESTLRNELTQQEGFKLGLSTAILIMRKTGDLKALDAIEEDLGRVAFFLPTPEDGKISDAMALVATMAKEFGESMQAQAASLADGKITKKEAIKCLMENKDMIKACLRWQAYLERI